MILRTSGVRGVAIFPFLAAMKEAFAAQNIPPEKMMFISGIGQAGKTPHFIQGNIFHTLSMVEHSPLPPVQNRQP